MYSIEMIEKPSIHTYNYLLTDPLNGRKYTFTVPVNN